MKRLALLPFAFLSAPIFAQDTPIPEEADRDEAPRVVSGEILVIANRLRDQVEAPQPPIMTYDEADIAAYGASSIADLIARTAPQTGSGRGR
jgi:iron complex outermembrane recepter protein